MLSKLLFTITSHKNPAQVIRLVNIIQTHCSDAFIVIHHDQTCSSLKKSQLSQYQNLHLLENTISITWGEFSVIESELNCLRWAKDSKISFDWIIALSGQDYPIRSISELQTLLASTKYDGFLEYFLATAPPSTAWRWGEKLGIERYHYKYFSVNPLLKPLFYKLYRPVNWQSLLRVKAGRFGAKVAIRRWKTIFSDCFRCYAGSQWHILNYRCVEYIQDFIQAHPKLVEYYRHTMVPDESFFQTILVNNPDFKLCNDNLRYISWQPPYPAIMKSKDLPKLINSGKYFARKFDTNADSQILDQLDQYLSQDQASNLSLDSSH